MVRHGRSDARMTFPWSDASEKVVPEHVPEGGGLTPVESLEQAASETASPLPSTSVGSSERMDVYERRGPGAQRPRGRKLKRMLSFRGGEVPFNCRSTPCRRIGKGCPAA